MKNINPKTAVITLKFSPILKSAPTITPVIDATRK